MLRRLQAKPPVWRSLRRASSSACCAAELSYSRPTPGTVRPYDYHVLVELPRDKNDTHADVPQWPKLVERHPAILSVFTALASHRDAIDGSVKVTAMGGGLGYGSPTPDHCNVLVFPQAVEYVFLPLQQAGRAAVHAIAGAPADGDIQACQTSRPGHRLYLFVCCHGARDKRCGRRGPELLAALRREIARVGAGDYVAAAATSHVGGHEFAANVIAYGPEHPCDGDWFGGLTEADAELFVHSLLNMELGCDGGVEDPRLRMWWRGRLGMDSDEQTARFAEIEGNAEV